MLLIPIHRKIDWSNPPVFTFLLILTNILIFSLFQLDDGQEVDEAIAYYEKSGLAEIELDAAINYAERANDQELSRHLQQVSPRDFPYWVFLLQTNTEFMRALQRGEIIAPDAEVYEEWLRKRENFTRLYESITYVSYGLRTAEPSILTLFSHMFLHAGFWHLFGNMLFLFAVGFLVEETMDRKSYLISYLLTGLGSAGFDILFRGDSLLPGIGASGAISGLMGIYAVLYGMKRIRFFYYIGVYFDYISLPAILLLPLWIGNELVQMQLYPESNVNFLAHLGGLCSGALIAIIIRKKLPSFSLSHMEEEEKQTRSEKELERVRELMAEMRPDRALPILRRLHQELPENREILTRYYECCRVKPANDEYHGLAHEIFLLTDNDTATDLLILETFNEYLKLARPSVRMTPRVVCQLARRFIRQKAMGESERLVRIILEKNLQCPKSRYLLQSFIQLLEEQGRTEERQHYLKQLNMYVRA
ncbi:MAG: rhomboid family intramembrane serine protease [Pseudomonadota bacterium]